MGNGMLEFGFGEGDERVGQKSKRFKGKEGETYRVSFVWWPGLAEGKPDLTAPTPRFIGCRRLYIPGVGYFIDKGPEYVKLAGGAQSKMQAATIICVWPTNNKGVIDKGRFANGEYSVQSWIMSADKYRSVEARHQEFPLSGHDVTLACTDTQFQKMDISPCRESLFKMLLDKNPERAQAIIADAQAIASTLANDLAQDLTLDQIRDKMGRGGSSPVASGSVASNASGDFDNMLDDLVK